MRLEPSRIALSIPCSTASMYDRLVIPGGGEKRDRNNKNKIMTHYFIRGLHGH